MEVIHVAAPIGLLFRPLHDTVTKAEAAYDITNFARKVKRPFALVALCGNA